jgi:hypothetical protein
MIQLGIIQIKSLDGTIADVKERLMVPCKVINETGNWYADHDLLTELYWLHCANSDVVFEKPSHFVCKRETNGALKMIAVLSDGRRMKFDPVTCLESLRQYCRSHGAILETRNS